MKGVGDFQWGLGDAELRVGKVLTTAGTGHSVGRFAHLGRWTGEGLLTRVPFGGGLEAACLLLLLVFSLDVTMCQAAGEAL